MPNYLIITQKSFTIEADNEDDASDKANDWLMENDPESNIEIIEEL